MFRCQWLGAIRLSQAPLLCSELHCVLTKACGIGVGCQKADRAALAREAKQRAELRRRCIDGKQMEAPTSGINMCAVLLQVSRPGETWRAYLLRMEAERLQDEKLKSLPAWTVGALFPAERPNANPDCVPCTPAGCRWLWMLLCAWMLEDVRRIAWLLLTPLPCTDSPPCSTGPPVQHLYDRALLSCIIAVELSETNCSRLCCRSMTCTGSTRGMQVSHVFRHSCACCLLLQLNNWLPA